MLPRVDIPFSTKKKKKVKARRPSPHLQRDCCCVVMTLVHLLRFGGPSLYDDAGIRLLLIFFCRWCGLAKNDVVGSVSDAGIGWIVETALVLSITSWT